VGLGGGWGGWVGGLGVGKDPKRGGGLGGWDVLKLGGCWESKEGGVWGGGVGAKGRKDVAEQRRGGGQHRGGEEVGRGVRVRALGVGDRER